MNSNSSNQQGNKIIGSVLVVLGLLFLLGQVFNFGDIVGSWGWPFFVVVPGILLLVGAFLGGHGASGLAVAGSIVTTVGLILFFQNLTNHFESWAYAWGLIVAAAGFGRFLQGNLNTDSVASHQGLQAARVGLVLFVAFAAFFELFIFQQNQMAKVLIPLALIGVGVYLLLRRGADRAPMS